MCGACEPVCPEKIDILAVFHNLRGELPSPALSSPQQTPAPDARPDQAAKAASRRLFLPGPQLPKHDTLLKRVLESLGATASIALSCDDGHDLALALELGAPINSRRAKQFTAQFHMAHELIVVEGILHRFLRQSCPHLQVTGLAEALLQVDGIRQSLKPNDLLVIDARGFHADHDRVVKVFDRIRQKTGCQMNLDLQRLAIPTSSDATAGNGADLESIRATAIEWMLRGRQVDRIVVESPLDIRVFETHTSTPVVHLAELSNEVVCA